MLRPVLVGAKASVLTELGHTYRRGQLFELRVWYEERSGNRGVSSLKFLFFLLSSLLPTSPRPAPATSLTCLSFPAPTMYFPSLHLNAW